MTILEPLTRVGCAAAEPDRGCSPRECAGELAAALDGELAVGVSKVELDGFDSHEQGLGDLAVGTAARGELGTPALRGSEGVRA